MPGKFTKRVLSHPNLGPVPCSMPLIIPNDTSYDISTNELKSISGETRSSLKVVPETLHLLETIDRPVAVLAIGGPCRSGKSYVLSRMLGSADDFALGHTFYPKTFGIWIGTTVLDSDQFTLLLMDTEGIDSVVAKARDDASILVMTVLLSSYFMYNSFGVPHHGDLEKMSYFANLATSIIVKNTTANEGSFFDLKYYFPDFLWLLRDVHLLPTKPDGTLITPTEYLLSIVLRRGTSFKETKNDEVGRAILTFFPSVECKTIQPPSSNPSVVRDIARQQGNLDPGFNAQIEELISYVFHRLQPKRGIDAGNLVDGPMLAAMTTEYLKAVNDPDAIPCIADTWNTALEKRCQEVLDRLTAEYMQDMETQVTTVGLPMEEDTSDRMDPHRPQTLFGIHRLVLLKKTELLIQQLGHYIGGPLGQYTQGSVISKESLCAELEHRTAVFKDEDTATEVEGRLIRRKRVVGGILGKFSQQNYVASRSSCLALFDTLYKPIKSKILNEETSYSFDQLLRDLKILHLEYFQKSVGPAKWDVYNEKREFIRAQKEAYSVLKGFQQKAFDAAQRAAEESTKAAQLADTVHSVQLQMRNDAELNQKRIEAMQKEHQQEIERLRREEADRMEKDKQKYEDFMSAHMKDMAEMSKENQEEMRQQNERMLEMMEKCTTANSEQISTLSKTVDQLTNSIAAMGQGGGGGGWIDTLMTVGGKVIETAIVAKACSIM